jgi:hypothetical protein
MLRRIFEPKRDEVTGEWRKLHNEELYLLYSSPNIRVFKLRRLKMGRACNRDAYRVFVGKPEGRRPLGRPRHRCEDNTKMDLRRRGMWDTDLIDLAQDTERWRALVNAVMNRWVP